jgi:hypothetical protein
MRFILCVLLAFAVGVFVEHDFSVVSNCRQQCCAKKTVECNKCHNMCTCDKCVCCKGCVGNKNFDGECTCKGKCTCCAGCIGKE